MGVSKKNKRIIIIALGAAVGALALIGYFLYPKHSKQSEYMFYKSHRTIVSNVNAALAAPSVAALDAGDTGNGNGNGNASSTLKKTTASKPDTKSNALFSNGKLIYSHATLEYFKHLETLFTSSSDLSDHLEKIRGYLSDRFPPEEAQILLDTYSKYLQCEMDLARAFAHLPTLNTPNATEDAIAMLEQIQATWRARLGKDFADMIFDSDVKATEYALRRADIVNNTELNGDEKESMIRQLDQDVWGNRAQAVEEQTAPFGRYQEKLKIYQNDLAEMDPADRQAQIQKFREEYFPPDVVQKLNDIDARDAAEKASEAQYSEKEKSINANPNLTDEEKKQQIAELQNQTFGNHADEFRRREAIQKAAESVGTKN